MKVASLKSIVSMFLGINIIITKSIFYTTGTANIRIYCGGCTGGRQIARSLDTPLAL